MPPLEAVFVDCVAFESTTVLVVAAELLGVITDVTMYVAAEVNGVVAACVPLLEDTLDEGVGVLELS